MKKEFTTDSWIVIGNAKKANTFDLGNSIYACFVDSKTEQIKPALALGFTKEEAEANANLIAAAPEMYQVLIDLRDGDYELY